MENTKTVVEEFIKNKNNYYLGNNKSINIIDVFPKKTSKDKLEKIDLKDICFYRINEITFDENAPRKEALENVISSMRIEGVNFIYLIMGDKDGVHFYFGVARDLYQENKDKNLLSINDVGDFILKPNIKGNFRGSKVKEVTAEEIEEINETIDNMKYYSLLEGVPGVNEDEEKYQSADRLVDVMLGDEFGFMIIAKPMEFDELITIERNLNEFYTKLVPLCKKSIQDSESENNGITETKTEGKSSSHTTNSSETEQDSTGSSDSDATGSSTTVSNGSKDSTGSSDTHTHTDTSNHSYSKTEGTSDSEGKNESKSIAESKSSGTSSSTTLEFIEKEYQDWIKYIDEVVIPRLDYGKGKGVFNTIAFLFSKKRAILLKLENTIKSLYAGEKGNRIPLQTISLSGRNKKVNLFKNYQIPHGFFNSNKEKNNYYSRSVVSQYANEDGSVILGNWISSNELSLIAGLPQKEIVGLGLKEEVQFGLNVCKRVEDRNKIHLGNLVHSGNILNNIDVHIDKNELNKHVFITGVTGSGKTTTCQKILIDSELPFLVIEPAKTEYRILAKKYDDIFVFTLGRDNVAPFRLNPFEFFPHESITSRVDMIKASMEASFDMEAAIPQIIENAIYECYKDYGWNISTNKNDLFENPFGDDICAFPTFSDLIIKIDYVVNKQGFDERLRRDYIGSIKARLESLTIGNKGLMLDTKRSIDFESLLEKKVVLELEEIRSSSEKSLIMGFILVNLLEAIKAKFKKSNEKGCAKFNHITLVEEAHRLLSKYIPGDSPNKKQGVEMFTDMLAEIRKYGESLIIVDQIPNKLTPEVLKNTNTKIVHKIFAQDDKEAIGNTMVLSDEQKGFLSNLEVGRAIVFAEGFQKAVQVQIEKTSDTTRDVEPKDYELRKKVLEIYCDSYKKGIFAGIDAFDEKPSIEEFEKFNDFIVSNKFIIKYKEYLEMTIGTRFENFYEKRLADDLQKGVDLYGLNNMAKILFKIYYKNEKDQEKYIADLEKLISEYINNQIEDNLYYMENLDIWGQC